MPYNIVGSDRSVNAGSFYLDVGLQSERREISVMDPLLLLLVGSVLIVAVALFVLGKRKPGEKKDTGDEQASRQPQQPTRVGGRPVRRTGMTRMIAARRAQDRRERLRDESPENIPQHTEDDPTERLHLLDEAFESLPNKLGTKKMMKLERKEQRAAERMEEQQRREEKKKIAEEREEARKQKEQERELEEQRKAEEEQKRKEEEEKRLYEEYLMLKANFSVEEEGTERLEEEESQSLLQEFISFIKETKVVMLDDLAAHFNLKTQDAISRLQTLLDEGRLEGMMDDRGKFIYLTMAELEAVAKFIRQHGRVTISDLAEASTSLINLETAQAQRETTVTA